MSKLGSVQRNQNQIAYPVNLSGSGDEVSGKEGSDGGDVFQIGSGGVGDDHEVFFDDASCQTLTFLTSGAHLVHPYSDTV